MTDCAPYYYRTNSASSSNDLDLDPPRTRIAVACNRCRRRKIKCSGSINNASCEACTRANNAECIFADRPTPTKLIPSVNSSAYNSPVPATTSIQLQPPSVSRSASLPTPHMSRNSSELPARTSSLTAIGLHSHSRTASPVTSHCNSPISHASPGLPKRPSVTSAGHPYQRPDTASSRKNSSEQIASTLQRYSQSLIQAQAMQLSGRQSQPITYRDKSHTGPTSVPTNIIKSNLSNAPFQLQPPLAHSPTFRNPEYGAGHQMSNMHFSQAPELMSSASTLYSGTPDMVSSCYSPVFPSDPYAASTPELISTDSFSTLNSRSTASLLSDSGYAQQQMPYVNQVYANQPYINTDYMQHGNMPAFDPAQWTPGVEKIANQWLQFSPQHNEQFF